MPKPTERYSAENLAVLNWYEHIRKRPGMYLGATNQRGFINVLREVMAAQAYGGPYARVGLVLPGPAAARLAFEAPPTTVQQVPGRAVARTTPLP